MSLEVLRELTDLKDVYLTRHQINVSYYAALLTKAMELDKFMCVIRRAALFHDVGKIGIPNEILFKPGRLTPEEWVFMKSHPITGSELVANDQYMKKLSGYREMVAAIRHHHEHWDGSGYPNRLKGNDIPLAARIISIADAFDAMTTSRPYQKSMSIYDALCEIKGCAGSQFDPILANLFSNINLGGDLVV